MSSPNDTDDEHEVGDVSLFLPDPRIVRSTRALCCLRGRRSRTSSWRHTRIPGKHS